MPHNANRFDVIVLGVGGMGSATVYQLARRGKRVLGLERFDIPNAMGSSHGLTRIIRLAYYEHPSYVPLLRRAYELWRELEQQTGERLLYITSSIDAGPAGSDCFAGSLRSAMLHNVPHDVLTGPEVNRRFPGYRLPADHFAVLQPDGGFLLSEQAIVTHVVAAQALGAEVHGRERVLEWQATADGVRIRTNRASYQADRLVVTAGAWAAVMLPELQRLAVPERQVLAWLQPTEPALFAAHHFPVFNLQVDEGRFYGFPIHGVPGFKFGRYHHLSEQTTAESVDRECHLRDEAVLREFAAKYFPAGNGPTMSLRACLFTNTPDEHFIIDLHPRHSQLVIAAGFSGHGYKFCSVVGEILADLAVQGSTRHDIGLFQLNRFGATTIQQHN
jgi:sarcosine oxidase